MQVNGIQASGGLATVGNFKTRSVAASGVTPWAEILVGSLFALCLIGLTHDAANLATKNEDSVEAGRGMEDIEEFHSDVSAAPLYRKVGFLGLIGLGCYCLATAPRDTRLQNFAVMLVLAACLTWLAASFLWSVAWRDTAREFVRIVAYAFVALSMALRFRPQKLCLVMMLALWGSVLAATAASVLAGNFQPWASDFRLHGTLHSNLLAHQALVVLLIAVALLPAARRVWFWRLVLVSAVAVILLTKTRGALGSAILGVVAIKLIGKPIWSVAFGGSILITLALTGALIVSVAGSHAQNRLEDMLIMGRSEGVGTLTGRIPLWEAVWDETQGHRWHGHGYGAFWTIDRTEKLSEELQWFPRHSHSAYMHTLVDLGFIGVGLLLTLVATCLAAAWRMFRATGDLAYTFYFGFLATGLMDGFVEICYVSPRELGLFVSMAILGLIVVHPPELSSTDAAEKPDVQTTPALQTV